MDFGNTPATKLTERIMVEIRPHLKQELPPQQSHHYNRVYEAVHRHVLAALLVDGLARTQGEGL